ncbi:MAG: HAMP domain-containing sensor histidine kinase [Dehalococcoidia bacterium]|nr:HAMP domain-containing sensor histidine kinase [Dehalococcoidia bacterium]
MIRSLLLPLLAFRIVIVLTVLVLLLSAWLLNPPFHDLALLGTFLLLSGGSTLASGHLLIRFGPGRFLSTLRGKLIFVSMISAALALINIGFMAQLMFISPHDLALLSVLLVFSLGISASFAVAVSESLQDTMKTFLGAVRQMGSGQLRSRININSHDEWEEVAQAFNAMAEQLEAAFARQSELEGARRHLVAAVSHDLRTPLASMRAMVESINDKVVTDSETVNRYLRTIQAEVEYLSQLIDDLFELSQIDSGLIELHVERGSVQDLISDTLETLSAQARQQHLTLQGEVDDLVPPLVMDTKRVQRVLYNLLQNAIRHTPEDGTIVIRATDAGSEIHVSVLDTGEGISPADLPRIFDEFHRTDKARSRSHGGSGLGLRIAKGIVEAHGGRIWAQSALGKGAVFTFTLPKSTSQAKVAESVGLGSKA